MCTRFWGKDSDRGFKDVRRVEHVRRGGIIYLFNDVDLRFRSEISDQQSEIAVLYDAERSHCNLQGSRLFPTAALMQHSGRQ